MSKNEIINSVTRAIGKSKLTLKKHSPELLLAVGIVGTVASTVMACKATTKAGDILDEAKEMIDKVHEVAENPENDYTEQDKNKAIAMVYAQTGLKYAKLYGPAVLTGVVSMGCILASHNIIHKRNLGLAAAYTAVDRSFKDYRGRVVERFGKELDRELKYNLKVKEIEETVVDENGNETVVTKQVQTADLGPDGSEFAFFFDETCDGWNRDAELNKCTLLQVQSWANDKLRTDGYLFLNDVRVALGAQKTRAGFQVGWVYEENNTEGDNYVDFRIFDVHNEQKRAFVNGYEKSILIDPNCDGVILERI